MWCHHSIQNVEVLEETGGIYYRCKMGCGGSAAFRALVGEHHRSLVLSLSCADLGASGAADRDGPFGGNRWLHLRERGRRLRIIERLRAAEARYRGVVEDQTESICRFLPDWTLTFVNEAYCSYWRIEDGLLGRSFMSFIPEEERGRRRNYWLH